MNFKLRKLNYTILQYMLSSSCAWQHATEPTENTVSAYPCYSCNKKKKKPTEPKAMQFFLEESWKKKKFW